MKLITAVIKPTKLETVSNALADAGFVGLTAAEVQGRGVQAGRTEYYRGQAVNVKFRTKIRIELVVADDQLERALNVLVAAAQTGSIGDGKVWVTEVVQVIRVRTGETGAEAV